MELILNMIGLTLQQNNWFWKFSSNLFYLTFPCRSKAIFAPVYFWSSAEKQTIRPLPCSSFSAKGHAALHLLACKRARDGSARYQLFAGSSPADNLSVASFSLPLYKTICKVRRYYEPCRLFLVTQWIFAPFLSSSLAHSTSRSWRTVSDIWKNIRYNISALRWYLLPQIIDRPTVYPLLFFDLRIYNTVCLITVFPL